ncbi:putative cytochrome P450 [Rosa chinensis]|uniref:Putative cytochrome P450 n=1 Tax=Rosa chinensis TaxID=74649 RepID=A0A2P6P5H0_ROSCH|nr:cytochrome P450 736A117 [Rosa chinensis]PRQ17175.1 putative cytochrome P450 [Rosa chinensis]
MNLLEILLDLNETFSLALVAIFLILVYRWSFTTLSKNSPPSPPKLPIIGNLHQLGLQPHRSLEALSQRCGPLMLLHFGSVPVLVVSSSEAASEIMRTHDLNFSNRPKSVILEKLLCNYKDVASAPYGEYWRQVKSICVLNLLSNKRVRSFRAVREDETKSMIDEITKHSSFSRVVNLSEMFATLTNGVICRVALGRKYSSADCVEGGQTFKELLLEFGNLLGTFSIGDFIPWLAWLNRVNGLNAKLDRVAKQFDDFLDKVIQDHKDDRSRSGNDGQSQIDNDNQNDFVDVLLEIQKANSLGFPLDIISIKALILDMFAAGTDTTYTVLEWAMTELLRHPSIMSKLQNEVREIVGNKSHITENDLVDMRYLKAVIKETLRLHPPIPLLVPRKSTQDVKINGYDIKANTQVIVNAWQIGRDSKSYHNPEEYDPERFLNTHSGIDYKGNDFQLIPFGAGRRICPGIQFAMAINEIALANLVYNFNWTLPGGAKCEDLEMSESTGVTIHRKYPLKVVAIPYSY